MNLGSLPQNKTLFDYDLILAKFLLEENGVNDPGTFTRTGGYHLEEGPEMNSLGPRTAVKIARGQRLNVVKNQACSAPHAPPCWRLGHFLFIFFIYNNIIHSFHPLISTTTILSLDSHFKMIVLEIVI